MIKKKKITKTKNKKRRKNPKNIDLTFYFELADAINNGDPIALSYAKTYLKQGYSCNDCEESYQECFCEGCEDCNYSPCQCDLNIPTYFQWIEIPNIRNKHKLKIQDEAKNLALSNLNKEQLVKLEEIILNKRGLISR
jgi:hypothetical protein